MNQTGNLKFIRGNKVALGNRGGGRRKADLAQMLERFAPRVIEVIEEQLRDPEPGVRWVAAKELLPYLWGRKSAVQVTQEGDKPTLQDYLAAKQAGANAAVPPPSPEPQATTDEPQEPTQ